MTTGADRLRGQLVEALRANLAGERPRVPEAGGLLWGAFLDLDGTRTWHAAGPNPIGFAEIEAWARLMGYPIGPRHVETLRAMDAAYIGHAAERMREERGR